MRDPEKLINLLSEQAQQENAPRLDVSSSVMKRISSTGREQTGRMRSLALGWVAVVAVIISISMAVISIPKYLSASDPVTDIILMALQV